MIPNMSDDPITPEDLKKAIKLLGEHKVVNSAYCPDNRVIIIHDGKIAAVMQLLTRKVLLKLGRLEICWMSRDGGKS